MEVVFYFKYLKSVGFKLFTDISHYCIKNHKHFQIQTFTFKYLRFKTFNSFKFSNIQIQQYYLFCKFVNFTKIKFKNLFLNIC